MLMQSLLIVNRVPAAVILNLMEGRGNGMKDTENSISTTIAVKESTEG
jgi:hypothetical protein